MSTLSYRLGLPAWGFPGWRDRYFYDAPSRLANYASVFNAVEGNTTFYGIPDPKTIARWRDAVAGTDFKFCLKLPREVTHDERADFKTLAAFLRAIEPLGNHLGPLLVQFPADIGPAEIARIDATLTQIAAGLSTVVEVRHPAFFSAPALLAPTLEQHNAGRVVLDAQALHRGDREHPEVVAALHKKPDLPVLADTTGNPAFIRLVLHPDEASNASTLDEWVRHAERWLREGDDLWMFIHCPNNLHCPPFARDFHRRLVTVRPGAGHLSEWPVPEQIGLL
ncbi:MAG: DUF72 domain-containing protein [Pseudomonadota bacterium]